MKKFIALLLSLMMLLTLAACGEKGKTTDGGEDAGSTKLNIFMWSDYLSDDVVANFEKEYGVKVNLSYMNDNADSITKLTAGAGDGYDLIMTCDAYMESLIAGDYLEKLDLSQVPNSANINKAYWSEQNQDYCVPYLMNYIYVVYDTERCPIEITCYNDLIDPALKGQLGSIDGARNLFPIALIALGYTMVYGIAKMLNFAHGDIIMIGAYTGIITVAQMGLPPLFAVLFSILLCALLGVLIEFLAYKPLRQAPPLSVLITAIGVSYFLQNLALLLFGSQQMAYPTLIRLGQVSVGGVTIDGITILTLLVTALIMVVLSFFINHTRLGKAMRAVSEDKAAASLMGISVNRTIALTFAIGSALAAVASIFYGMSYVYIKPTTRAMPGIKAFTAAVFGGIGSVPGAMLGGILLGLIEQLSKTYISTLWADAIVFGVLVVVLVVKPTGLLGKKMNEKV